MFVNDVTEPWKVDLDFSIISPSPQSLFCDRLQRTTLSLSLSLSLSLFLSLYLFLCVSTAIFSGELVLAGFIEAEDDGDGGDKWSYKSCKAAVKLSPPTNQRPVTFLQAGCACCRSANSVKALKGKYRALLLLLILLLLINGFVLAAYFSRYRFTLSHFLGQFPQTSRRAGA